MPVVTMIAYHSAIFSFLLALSVYADHEDADFAMAVVAGEVQKALEFAARIDINKEMPSLRRGGIIEDYYRDLGGSAHPIPLAFVAYVGNRIILNALLLDTRLNVNAANSDGITALHAAIFNNKEDMVYLLLQHGADQNAKSRKKSVNMTGVGDPFIITYETAQDLARRKGNATIIGYLKSPPERILVKEPIVEIVSPPLEVALSSFSSALSAIFQRLQ